MPILALLLLAFPSPARAASTCGDVTSGLVGYWRLDESSGATAADSSGNGNNGALQNSPTWTASGKINNALTLNGTNQDVFMNSATGLPAINAAQTISLWYKVPSNPGDARDFITVRNAAGSAANEMAFYYGSLVVEELGGVSIVSIGSLPSAGAWHLVTWTWDGTLNTLYVDGAAVATSNTTPQSGSAEQVYLGTWGGAGEFLSGSIDDARIYNRALSAAEVAQLAGNSREGDIIYNHNYCTPQYCDGATWRPMAHPRAPNSCTCGTASIGDVCADGSVYAGLSTDGNVPMYAQLCDIGQTWSGSACTGTRSTIVWSAGATIVTGITNSDTGQANTATLAALSNADSPYSAAITCHSLNEDGHTDWYLPAMHELQVLGLAASAIGNFSTSSEYWTSTELANNAAQSFFISGGGVSDYKSYARYVRCVRR